MRTSPFPTCRRVAGASDSELSSLRMHTHLFNPCPLPQHSTIYPSPPPRRVAGASDSELSSLRMRTQLLRSLAKHCSNAAEEVVGQLVTPGLTPPVRASRISALCPRLAAAVLFQGNGQAGIREDSWRDANQPHLHCSAPTH